MTSYSYLGYCEKEISKQTKNVFRKDVASWNNTREPAFFFMKDEKYYSIEISYEVKQMTLQYRNKDKSVLRENEITLDEAMKLVKNAKPWRV